MLDSEPGLMDPPIPSLGHPPSTIREPFQAVVMDAACFRPIHVLIDGQVEKTPEAIAVTFGADSLSYRELNRRSNQLGNYLRALGVAPEARVAVCMEPGLELVLAMLGILKTGGAVLPLDSTLPAELMADILDGAQATIILTLSSCFGSMPKTRVRVLPLDTRWSRVAQMSSVNPKNHVEPDNIALVSLAFSGTKAAPKLVTQSHDALIRQLQWLQNRHGLACDDSLLLAMPHSPSSFLRDLSWTLISGGRLVLVRPPRDGNRAELVQLTVGETITTLLFPASPIQSLLQEPKVRDGPRVRLGICSGGVVSPELRSAFVRLPPAQISERSEASTDAADGAATLGYQQRRHAQ